MSSAVPGTSEHQTGLAMDITSQSAKFQLETVFGKRKKVSGFLKMPINLVLLFDTQKRKETITGYRYEPWHVRYVEIHKLHICMIIN